MRVLPLDSQVQEVPSVHPFSEESSNMTMQPIFMIAYHYYQETQMFPIFGNVKNFKKLVLRHYGILEKFMIENKIELVVMTELDPGVDYSYEECREIYAKLALLGGSAARVKVYPPLSVCTAMMDKALRDGRFPAKYRIPSAQFALEKIILVQDGLLHVQVNTTLFTAISQLRQKVDDFDKVWHFEFSREK